MTCMQHYPLQTLDQLPELLRAFRKLRGLTQAEAAEKLGVTQQVLSSVERDPRKTSVGRLYKLLSALNVSITLSCADAPSEQGEVAANTPENQAALGTDSADSEVQW